MVVAWLMAGRANNTHPTEKFSVGNLIRGVSDVTGIPNPIGQPVTRGSIPSTAQPPLRNQRRPVSDDLRPTEENTEGSNETNSPLPTTKPSSPNNVIDPHDEVMRQAALGGGAQPKNAGTGLGGGGPQGSTPPAQPKPDGTANGTDKSSPDTFANQARNAYLNDRLANDPNYQRKIEVMRNRSARGYSNQGNDEITNEFKSRYAHEWDNQMVDEQKADYAHGLIGNGRLNGPGAQDLPNWMKDRLDPSRNNGVPGMDATAGMPGIRGGTPFTPRPQAGQPVASTIAGQPGNQPQPQPSATPTAVPPMPDGMKYTGPNPNLTPAQNMENAGLKQITPDMTPAEQQAVIASNRSVLQDITAQRQGTGEPPPGWVLRAETNSPTANVVTNAPTDVNARATADGSALQQKNEAVQSQLYENHGEEAQGNPDKYRTFTRDEWNEDQRNNPSQDPTKRMDLPPQTTNADMIFARSRKDSQGNTIWDNVGNATHTGKPDRPGPAMADNKPMQDALNADAEQINTPPHSPVATLLSTPQQVQSDTFKPELSQPQQPSTLSNPGSPVASLLGPTTPIQQTPRLTVPYGTNLLTDAEKQNGMTHDDLSDEELKNRLDASKRLSTTPPQQTASAATPTPPASSS